MLSRTFQDFLWTTPFGPRTDTSKFDTRILYLSAVCNLQQTETFASLARRLPAKAAKQRSGTSDSDTADGISSGTTVVPVRNFT